MIKKIKQLLLITVTSLGLLAPGLLTPIFSGAVSADIASNVCAGSVQASQSANTACTSTSDPSSSLESLAKTITEWFSIVVGAISIIMIIYGGFRYITSGGDSGRVGSAKNTLIYAIVGLVIVALAQIIVNFVLAQASTTSTNLL